MTTTQWQYLEKRPQSWRQQLFFKDRKLRASTVWSDMLVNGDTPEAAAENWDLPKAAIEEAIRYCDSHRELLSREAEKERRYLEERGVILEPKITHR